MVSSNTTAIPSRSHVYFRYQSHNIPFTEWIKLITICLAPLITHIAFGYGTPVLLSERRPKLLDQLTQFNPVTIIWRWYAIVNRRVRAHDWDRADMAASNAIFWDGYRWDGSEELMVQSRLWVTKLPQRNRIELVSSSTLATVAMALQGVSAMVLLAQSFRKGWTGPGWGLPDIFNMLAVLSFARLPAALWLSNECGFEAVRRPSRAYAEETSNTETSWGNETASTSYRPLKHTAPLDISEPSTFQDFFTPTITTRLKPNSAFPARLWAAFGIFFALVGCGTGIYMSVAGQGPRPFVIITQLSSLCVSLYYLVLSLSAVSIFIFYIIKGKSGNTALPCMNAIWFKWLNVGMIVLAVVMFVTTALETTILPDGKVETYPIPPP